MVVGVISSYQRQRIPFGIKVSHNGGIIRVELPVSADKFAHLSERRKQRYMRRAEKLLKRVGADCIVCEKGIEGEARPSCTAWMPYALDFGLKKCGLKPADTTLTVFDRELKVANCEFMEAFCKKLRYLKVYTDEYAKAVTYAEHIFDKYGLYVEVLSYKQGNPMREFPMLDVDCEKVRLSRDFCIDGAMPDIDVGGADISVREAFAASYECNAGVGIKYYTSGKNKLTTAVD